MTAPAMVLLPQDALEALRAELAALRELVQTVLRQQSGVPVLAMSREEACESLRIGKSSLNDLIQSGELPTAEVCGRRLISVDDVRELLRRKTAEPVRPLRTGRPKREATGTTATPTRDEVARRRAARAGRAV